MIVTVALSVLGLTTALQLFFQIRFFRHLMRIPIDGAGGSPGREPTAGIAPLPVSVIICAHDEAANLERCLRSVLRQHYLASGGLPAFEVVVVNDASTDGSAALLERMQQEFPQLRVVTIRPDEDRPLPGKKFALSRGLAAAAHEVIVCTDADCEPASEIWLHCMAAPFREGKSIVAGYGGYRRYPGLLNWFIRYETMHTFLLYYAFWKGAAPYMAVGRNMAARKSVFAEASRHPAWSALPSGDDDLLVQLCATRQNMDVVVSPKSFTWSEPKRSAADYLAQKKRHVSTGKFYRPSSKMLLSLYCLMRLLTMCAIAGWVCVLLLGSPTGLITRIGAATGQSRDSVRVMIAAGTFLLSAFVGLNGFSGSSRVLGERGGALRWFLFSFCWLLYNTVLAPWILWKSKQRWK